jgi:hypothetical protein
MRNCGDELGWPFHGTHGEVPELIALDPNEAEIILSPYIFARPMGQEALDKGCARGSGVGDIAQSRVICLRYL